MNIFLCILIICIAFSSFVCYVLTLKGFLQLIILALVDLFVYLFNAPAGGLIEFVASPLCPTAQEKRQVLFMGASYVL